MRPLLIWRFHCIVLRRLCNPSTWTVVFSDNSNVSINSNTTNYQLYGLSLTIATFTPLVESLACRIKVTGEPPFQGKKQLYEEVFCAIIGVLEGMYWYTTSCWY